MIRLDAQELWVGRTMLKPRYLLTLMMAVAPGLSGCGLYVPDTHGLGQDQLDEIADENEIVNQIKCEIHRAADPQINGASVAWIDTWAAKVSLILTVDEKGSLNPGFSLTEPHSAPAKGQLFSLSGGIGASADATRKETIGFTFSIPDLLKERQITNQCANENGVLIHSDLKIADFVQVKSNLAKIPGTIPGPYTAFTYQATFIVTYSGNITPTWKLVRFTANPGSNFLTASRMRTNDLVITFAPLTSASAPGQTAQIAPTGETQHASALIGEAVASGIQSRQ